MEEAQNLKVIFTNNASANIDDIVYYIAERGYPENADKFRKELFNFGRSLAIFPNKYPLCRHARFVKRNMRCAAFHKNYLFVYKVVKNKLVIYNVIHGKALK